MVRKQHLRLDHLRSLHQLFGSHRVWLVTGQECNVDILDVSHLRNILSVTGNIDSQAIDGQNISVVTTLGMEHRASLGRVIGGHCLHLEVIGNLLLVSIRHHLTSSVHLHTTLVHNELRALIRQNLDSLLIEVVAMLMGDEQIVGLGHCGIVDRTVS